MIDAKVEHLWNQGLIFEARVYAGMKRWFMRGLPSPARKGDDLDNVSAKCGLAAAIEMFRWRGEVAEEEETRRSGVDLLYWSTIADNLGAVRALATKGNAFPGGRLRFHRAGKCKAEWRGSSMAYDRVHDSSSSLHALDICFCVRIHCDFWHSV